MNDSELSDAQRLRLFLREFHRKLDPAAPRVLSTRDRAAAVFAKLAELAGDNGLLEGVTHGRSNTSNDAPPPALPTSGRSAGRGAPAAGATTRRASAGSNGSAKRGDAGGVKLAEPEPEAEPESDRGLDRFIRWLTEN